MTTESLLIRRRLFLWQKTWLELLVVSRLTSNTTHPVVQINNRRPLVASLHDCGVFVIHAVRNKETEFLLGDQEPKFSTQTEMFVFRHQIAVEIIDTLEN